MSFFVISFEVLVLNFTNLRLSDSVPEEPKPSDNIPWPSATSQSTPQKCILDLSNWISSSEDDSFAQKLLRPDHQKNASRDKIVTEKGNNIHSANGNYERKSFLRSLLSSPVDLVESVLRPSAASQLRTPVSRIVAQTLFTDPIESSSPILSSPQKQKSKQKEKDERPKRAKTKDLKVSKNKDGRSSKEWRDANRATRKKEEIMAEMVLEVALCLNPKTKSNYFKCKFENVSVRDTYIEVPLISWKRRVKALYCKDRDIFVPCELTELSESMYILVYEGAELPGKLKDGSVNEDLQKVKKRAEFENPQKPYHVVIVSPGFQAYLRKLQAAEDREYRRITLQRLEKTAPSKGTGSESLGMKAIEAQVLRVQTELALGINIFTCKDMDEVIDWLHTFTYTLGSSLYNKYERNPEYANFGNVKLGTDKKLTFIKMLLHFNLVTAPKAEKIRQFYPSPVKIYQRFMEHDNLGSFSGKPIVPVTVNNAMRRVFMSTDPNQVITD